MTEDEYINILRITMEELNKSLDELRESKSRRDREGSTNTDRLGIKYYSPVVGAFTSEDYEKLLEVGESQTWEEDAWNIYDLLFEVLVRKQRDYGPDNIRRSPGGALNGLTVRLYDKIARLNNLISTGATPENESLRDTFIDIANYGVIGIMILDDTFPKSKDA